MVGISVDNDLEDLVGKPKALFDILARATNTLGVRPNRLRIRQTRQVSRQFLSEDILKVASDVGHR